MSLAFGTVRRLGNLQIEAGKGGGEEKWERGDWGGERLSFPPRGCSPLQYTSFSVVNPHPRIFLPLIF